VIYPFGAKNEIMRFVIYYKDGMWDDVKKVFTWFVTVITKSYCILYFITTIISF